MDTITHSEEPTFSQLPHYIKEKYFQYREEQLQVLLSYGYKNILLFDSESFAESRGAMKQQAFLGNEDALYDLARFNLIKDRIRELLEKWFPLGCDGIIQH